MSIEEAAFYFIGIALAAIFIRLWLGRGRGCSSCQGCSLREGCPKSG